MHSLAVLIISVYIYAMPTKNGKKGKVESIVQLVKPDIKLQSSGCSIINASYMHDLEQIQMQVLLNCQADHSLFLLAGLIELIVALFSST